MSLLKLQVENSGRCSARGPRSAHIQTVSKLTEEKSIPGFTKGISLQDIFPATFIVQVGKGVGFLHMLSIACGLLFQHSNALSYQMPETDEGTLVLITYPSPGKWAGLEPFTVTNNMLSLSNRLLKAHTKAKET